MMLKSLWKALLVSPAAFGVVLGIGKSAIASPQKPLLASHTPEVTQVATIQTPEKSAVALDADVTPAIASNSQTELDSPAKISNRQSEPAEANISTPASVTMEPNKPDMTDPADREMDNLDREDNADDGLAQITNVSQFSDVRPGDWAYEALRNLVERYGCIAGYPNSTFRGNRALSRYEFAAGLNACLRQIEKLIAAGTADFTSKQDLAKLQRLTDEFGTELAKLRGRVDGLEARTAELEARQFSTTTKLSAEVVVAAVGVARGENALGNRIPRITALGDRVRLNLETSFTGKDLLRTRLQANGLSPFSGTSTFTPEGDLRFAGGGGAFSTPAENNNNIALDALLYQFPIGEKTTVVIEANAGAIDDFTNTVNPFLDGDGGSGALTNFGTRNPIYYLLNGAGIGLKHEFSDNLEISLGYLANAAADPSSGNGIFRGPYGAMAQLTVKPFERLTVGLTYINAYNTDFTANGSSGSNRANLRSALASNPAFLRIGGPATDVQGIDLPTSSNAYGVQASFQVSPNFVINGWAGYTTTRTLRTVSIPAVPGVTPGLTLNRGDLSIWNFAVNLAFPDLGKKGSVAGIIFGMEPRVTRVSRSLRNVIGADASTSLHREGFYQFQLTENVAITPGFVWLTAPDHNKNNADAIIGVIRTTFTF